MLKLNLTMQENYNGWECIVDGDEEPNDVCEAIMEELPSITSECYDDDGYCQGDPSAYEREVNEAIAKIVNEPFEATIKYDEFSS